mgnify:CR=1 FL=1
MAYIKFYHTIYETMVAVPFYSFSIQTVFPHVLPRPDAGMSYHFRLAEVLHLLVELRLRGLDDVITVLLEGKSEFFYRCPAFAMNA